MPLLTLFLQVVHRDVDFYEATEMSSFFVAMQYQVTIIGYSISTKMTPYSDLVDIIFH